MAQRFQDTKPARSAESRAWFEENLAEQETRYREITAEMEALEPTRRTWYTEFLSIIRTRGYNVTGDQRRRIGEAEVPKKPARKDRVVY